MLYNLRWINPNLFRSSNNTLLPLPKYYLNNEHYSPFLEYIPTTNVRNFYTSIPNLNIFYDIIKPLGKFIIYVGSTSSTLWIVALLLSTSHIYYSSLRLHELWIMDLWEGILFHVTGHSFHIEKYTRHYSKFIKDRSIGSNWDMDNFRSFSS